MFFLNYYTIPWVKAAHEIGHILYYGGFRQWKQWKQWLTSHFISRQFAIESTSSYHKSVPFAINTFRNIEMRVIYDRFGNTIPYLSLFDTKLISTWTLFKCNNCHVNLLSVSNWALLCIYRAAGRQFSRVESFFRAMYTLYCAGAPKKWRKKIHIHTYKHRKASQSQPHWKWKREATAKEVPTWMNWKSLQREMGSLNICSSNQVHIRKYDFN